MAAFKQVILAMFSVVAPILCVILLYHINDYHRGHTSKRDDYLESNDIRKLIHPDLEFERDHPKTGAFDLNLFKKTFSDNKSGYFYEAFSESSSFSGSFPEMEDNTLSAPVQPISTTEQPDNIGHKSIEDRFKGKNIKILELFSNNKLPNNIDQKVLHNLRHKIIKDGLKRENINVLFNEFFLYMTLSKLGHTEFEEKVPNSKPNPTTEQPSSTDRKTLIEKLIKKYKTSR